ncbi:MAG: ribose 5-phosphate isomerase A [Erysipelotrichaceae bacterium]|nr:ribose 5-phosphate isomerase A [Erysipelotrichaceae bacterium]MDD3810593.1 ribose 5-phosphate isomerase A [Erysipelotrichaceae bacterium]
MGDELKKAGAKEALKLIKSGRVVGLGGGSTIAYLVGMIAAENLDIKVVTPSMKTRMLCLSRGLEVMETFRVEYIDIAFDGCDEVDEDLNALKSGGGIHTLEKLIGAMADEYILLVDESKVSEALTFSHPVVLEIIKEAMGHVARKVEELGGIVTMRQSGAKDGFTITEHGNLLMDVQFAKVDDIAGLEAKLKNINGVIATSLFVTEVTGAIVTSEQGVRVLSRKTEKGE